MLRKVALISAIVLAPFTAEAVTCHVIGDQTLCDNGVSATTIGDIDLYSNGGTGYRIGDTYIYDSPRSGYAPVVPGYRGRSNDPLMPPMPGIPPIPSPWDDD